MTTTSRRGSRIGVRGAALAAMCLGLAAPASAGEMQWKRQLGSLSMDMALGVATDGMGDVYLVGFTGDSLVGAHRGGDDAWIVKYDPTGSVLWTRQLGTGSSDSANDVATDATGNVFVTGWTSGALAGANRGSQDTWVIKYNAAGEKQWGRQFGSIDNESPQGIATDVDGNVYLTGETSGAIAGTSSGAVDAFVLKYDPDGQEIWRRQFGTGSDDYAFGLATDPAGNVLLTGTTDGSLAGSYRGGYGDGWVMKFDAGGNELWRHQFGTKELDLSSGVATDTTGNVYVAGLTDGSLAGANRGAFDAWVLKFDTDGNEIWRRQFGTLYMDEAKGITTDTAGNIYLTGRTDGSLGAANRNSTDAWLMKLDAAGNVLWRRQPGTRHTDVAWAVAKDAADGVYIVGWTDGSFVPPNLGRDDDAWIAKYSSLP